ncbi:MAG TPA: hypothetical protein VGD78_22960 [Chthoniobacterales bacterium]
MKGPESRRLADLLGIPVHRSWLLRKLRFDGVDTPETLIALAVQRGCYHYQTNVMAPAVSIRRCSNEALAAALLSPNNLYNPRLIRAGAMLLSGTAINPERLVLEALRERCGEVLLHVVKAAQRVDSQSPRWNKLFELIAHRFRRLKPVNPGILPSDGRFCVETGFIGRKKAKQVHLTWLRPIRTES